MENVAWSHLPLTSALVTGFLKEDKLTLTIFTTVTNGGKDRVTLRLKNSPFFTRKRLQLCYNPKVPYLPFFKKSQLHKLLFIKKLGRTQKIGNVFNGRRQLVSDIGRHLVTWIPQRKFFCGNKDFSF